jgi:hypothetical protein
MPIRREGGERTDVPGIGMETFGEGRPQKLGNFRSLLRMLAGSQQDPSFFESYASAQPYGQELMSRLVRDLLVQKARSATGSEAGRAMRQGLAAEREYAKDPMAFRDISPASTGASYEDILDAMTGPAEAGVPERVSVGATSPKLPEATRGPRSIKGAYRAIGGDKKIKALMELFYGQPGVFKRLGSLD